MIRAAGPEPHRFDRLWTGCLVNLSRTASVHGSLRDHGLLEVAELMISKSTSDGDAADADPGDKTVLDALLPLVHVFVGEASDHPAQKLLRGGVLLMTVPTNRPHGIPPHTVSSCPQHACG
jgi:hypothetical protein